LPTADTLHEPIGVVGQIIPWVSDQAAAYMFKLNEESWTLSPDKQLKHRGVHGLAVKHLFICSTC
jgi:hypothetical protein